MRDLETGLQKQMLQQQQTEEEEGSEESSSTQQEDGQQSISSSIVTQHQSLLRNKRCVLAYHYERMKRVRKLRWGSGAVQNFPSFIKQNMSEDEVKYLNEYDEILRQYSDDIGFDLFSDVTPPKDVFVEVRVIKEDTENSEGIMTLESGVITLKKNDTLYLRRVDAEMLIQRGLVEQVIKQVK